MSLIKHATEHNNSFSKVQPGMQLFWDSTSLGAFKTCRYKYFLSIVMGWTPKYTPDPLRFGILFHSAMENYERLRQKNLTHIEALKATVLQTLKDSGERNSEGRFIPWEAQKKERSRMSLIRSIIWFLDWQKTLPRKTLILPDGRPAVELSFKFSTGWKTSDGEPIFICGHLDKMLQFPDETIYVNDYKTTTIQLSQKFFEKFSPDNQMSLYTIASQIVFDIPASGVLISGIQLQTYTSEFKDGFALRTKGQNEEWLEDTRHTIQDAEKCAKEGNWPMNDTACDMYGGCKFRDVCSQDPKSRQAHLERDFKREMWDCTVERGD